MKVLNKRSAALNRKPTLEIINKPRTTRNGKVPVVSSPKKVELIKKTLLGDVAVPKRRGRPPLKNKENVENPTNDNKPKLAKNEPKKRGRKPKSLQNGTSKTTENIPQENDAKSARSVRSAAHDVSSVDSKRKETSTTPHKTPVRRGRKKVEKTLKTEVQSKRQKSTDSSQESDGIDEDESLIQKRATKRSEVPSSPSSSTSSDKSATTKDSTDKLVETNNNISSPSPTTVCDLLGKARRKYQCGVCDKHFLGSNDLRKHLRIHSDERPYLCPHCDKSFRQAGCLKNHIASQHGTDTVYTCDYCNKGFPIKERLRLHIRIHTGRW